MLLFEPLENRALYSAAPLMPPGVAPVPDAYVPAAGKTSTTFTGSTSAGQNTYAELDLTKPSTVTVKIRSVSPGETLTLYNSQGESVKSTDLGKRRSGLLSMSVSAGTWYAGVNDGDAQSDDFAIQVLTLPTTHETAATDPLAQPAAQIAPASTPTGSTSSSQFVLDPNGVATTVRYGNSTFDVYPVLLNSQTTNASQWQFRYAPLMQPQGDPSGSGNPWIEEVPNGKGGYYVNLHLLLNNTDMRAAALTALQANYPAQASALNINNIEPMELTSISFDGNEDLLSGISGAFITTPTINLGAGAFPDTAVFQVQTSSQSVANEVESAMRETNLNYSLNFNADTVETNSVTVTYSEVRSTNLYINLSGDGGADYVSRLDLQNVADDIVTNLSAQTVVENPGAFSQSIVDNLISIMQDGADHWFTGSSDKLFSQTYDAADLSPTVITSELQSLFYYNSGTNSWQVNESNVSQLQESGGASANILDIFGGSVSEGVSTFDSSNYSNSGFQSWLTQQGITTSFSGNEVIAKSVLVYQVNTGALSGNGTVTSGTDYVTPANFANGGSAGLASYSDLPATPTDATLLTQLQGRAAGWDSAIATINGEIKSIQSQLNTVSSSIPLIEMGTSQSGELLATTPFSANYTFSKPFKTVPQIFTALSGLDVWNTDNTRVINFPTNITKTGFTMNIQTWAGTNIANAIVAWMAVGT